MGFDVLDSAHFQKILTDFRDRFADIIGDYEFVSILKWNKFTYYPFKEASEAPALRSREV